jgi:hypothetical protein
MKKRTRNEGGKEIEMDEVLGGGRISQTGSGGANKIGLLLGGIGAGALLMYLFDPDRGRGRRSRIGDQMKSKANRLGRTTASKARDLRNRTQGLLHDMRSSGSNKSRIDNTSDDYQPMEQGT